MNEICWNFCASFGDGNAEWNCVEVVDVLILSWWGLNKHKHQFLNFPMSSSIVAPTCYIQSCLFTLKNSFKIRPTTRIPQTNALYTQFPLISTQFWFVFAKRWARRKRNIVVYWSTLRNGLNGKERKFLFYNSVVDKFSLNFPASYAKEARNLLLVTRNLALSPSNSLTHKLHCSIPCEKFNK